MGDVIRQEGSPAGSGAPDQNLGRIGNALRAKDGLTLLPRGPGSGQATGKGCGRSRWFALEGRGGLLRAHAEEFHLVEVYAPRKRVKVAGDRAVLMTPGVVQE